MTEKLHPAPSPEPLPSEELRWRCDPGSFDFEDTSNLDAAVEIIGQRRALKAITLGLEMKSPGYNIFLAGFVGTGRNTTIERVLQTLDRGTVPPDDLCYVYNFARPGRPRAIFVIAGKGRRLVRRMKLFVGRLIREIPQVFESESYRKRKERIQERFKERQRAVIQKFEKHVEAEDFALVQVQVGAMTTPEVVPVVEGEPKFLSDLEESVESGQLKSAQLDGIREKHRKFSSELQGVVKEAMKIESEMTARFAEHDRDVVRPIVAAHLGVIRDEFSEFSEVVDYLNQVENHCMDHLDRFVPPEDGPAREIPSGAATDTAWCLEYQVNLVVDNHDTEGAPVVLENSPNAASLFGMLERHWVEAGEGTVDHMRIRGGTLLSANGGYLVLNASDLFSEPPLVWNSLKRILRTGSLEIRNFDGSSMLGPPALKPEPVCIDVKVVLIGDSQLYSLLYSYDDEFRKIFKVRADFDTEMANTIDNVIQYGSFVQRLVKEEGVLPFDRTGLSEIVEYGVRLTGRQNKLSTRFNMIADLIREASYFAGKDQADRVSSTHLSLALEEKIYRNNLAEEKMQELIEEGSIFIDVEGRKPGAVNGLAVYESGDHAFGLPSKITATVSVGNAGIINIEREAELSGRTHDKGVQILSGYIRSKYAQDQPLTLSASVCFEQSYHGVDGDSASSTEIYALLSALSGISVRQDLAVTGSVNQKGDIQPIGGVNEKIEGFYDVCRTKGLTGTQGVIIPKTNVVDLMLHPRVLESVHKGEFHVYAVESIDEGIEILTGVAAGAKEGRRTYPRLTVNGRVSSRLKRLANQMREYGGQT